MRLASASASASASAVTRSAAGTSIARARTGLFAALLLLPLPLLLSSCGTSSMPCIVSRDSFMRMAIGPKSKMWTYHYIGATAKGVYLEANESRILKSGSQTYVYMAPRSHFTEADLAKLAGREQQPTVGR